jgi:hypothetical protein
VKLVLPVTLLAIALAACGDDDSTSADGGQPPLTLVHVSGTSAPGATVSAGMDECVIPCTVHARVTGCEDITLHLTSATTVDLVVDTGARCTSYRALSGMPTATISEVSVRLKRRIADGTCYSSPSLITYGSEAQMAMEPMGLDDAPCGPFGAP